MIHYGIKLVFGGDILLRKRVTEKKADEILLEAFLESGVDCSLRPQDQKEPDEILVEENNSLFPITKEFNIFDEKYQQ